METEGEDKKFGTTIVDAMHMKSFSVEKLAQVTGISDRVIRLMIDESWDKLPPAPYVHGYLVKLGDTLGLDGDELWRTYVAHRTPIHRSGVHDTLPENRFIPARLNRRVIVGVGIGIAVIAYIAFRLPALTRAPSLSLERVSETPIIVTTETFILRGTIDTRTALTINGEVTHPAEDGSFTRTISLQPGFNTITVRAERFLGKEKEIIQSVFFDTEDSAKNTTSTTKEE